MLNLSEIDVSRWPHWLSDDGNVLLVNADCLEVLPVLPKVDCIITDPPYGVNFKYESHDDTPVGYGEWCKSWFSALPKSTATAISCGLANIGLWASIKEYRWILAWHKPASMGRCAVGFNNWEPVVMYGKAPKQICDVFRACIIPDDSINGHPCPKPLEWGMWQVENLTADKAVVVDCFAGSGTVGVACVRLGRQFIGIEKEPKYYEIAIKRIKAEQERFPLFEKPTKQEAKTLPGFDL